MVLMSVPKVNKSSKELFVYAAILFILLLTAVNLGSFLKPESKVLGVETDSTNLGQTNSEQIFWESFLKIHPKYIPGWIELGELDKVREIDPNYF